MQQHILRSGAQILGKLAEAFGPSRTSDRISEPRVFHSKFGGLWTDRYDAEDRVAAKLDSGLISWDDAERLRLWIRDGYVILRNAVPHDVIDRLVSEIDQSWDNPPDWLLAQTAHSEYIPLEKADRNQPLTKLLDFYVQSNSALEVMFSSSICHFLNLIFEDDILGFQSLTFERGSTQAIHQDTAYVVCSSPMTLAASWVALEDIEEGSGELQYYPGSHRFGDFNFGDPDRKHWNAEQDGNPIHDHFLNWLHETAKEKEIERLSFLPKKGDALIWSADLAHGGGAISRPELTRRSFVTHYCPRNVDPHYFLEKSVSKAKKNIKRGCFVSSRYYEFV